MKIKIKTQQQLEGIIYTWFKEHNNCVVKLYDELCNDFFYFTLSRLNNTSILLSMCAGEISAGDVVNINDNNSIMNWIHNKCNYIDFNVANLTAYLEENKTGTNLNFRQEYLKNHIAIKKNVPILITNINDAMDLFVRFLKNDQCTKLIFSFKVYIQDLKHTFLIDSVIDKSYVYNKTCISFSTVRPDIKGYFPDRHDSIYRYFPNNKENLDELKDECESHLNTLFIRCMAVSKEEIDIYAYSNCEVI